MNIVSVFSGILCLTLLAGCNGGSSSKQAPTTNSATLPLHPAELGPLISGSSSWLDGTYVWTDYAYDDHGANSDGEPGGDGEGGYTESNVNGADIVQVQVGLTDDGWWARFILQTLTDPSVPVLGLAVDSDNRPDSGAAKLPGWDASGPLGVDHLFILRNNSVSVRAFSDGNWEEIHSLPLEISLENNTLDMHIPGNLLLPDGIWRIFGLAGVATDAEGDAWPEGGVILDLAFVGQERPILLQTARQGDILAGTLHSSEAAAVIDWQIAESGATQVATAPNGAFSTFLHHSSLTLPEGVRAASGTIQGLEYLGPYQPYLVWLPSTLPNPAPLHVFLHGASQNHLGDTWVNIDGWPYHGLTPATIGGYAGNNKPVGTDPDDVYLPNDGAVGSIVHIERTFAPYDAPGVMIFPLGRMNSSFYSGIFEADVFEAIADIRKRIPIDPNRISLSGSSMGGIGSFRLGVLYPHFWSHVFPIVGDGSDVISLLGNLYNVPVRMHNGLFDPLVSQPGPSDTATALAAADIDYRYWLLETREHESLFQINHCVRDQAFTQVRRTVPAVVRYRLEREYINQEPELRLNQRYDEAYWLSGITLRDGEDSGEVEAINLLDTAQARQLQAIDERHQNISSGRDECGINPNVQTLDTWSETGSMVTDSNLGSVKNGVSLTLSGLQDLTVNLDDLDTNTASTIILQTNTDDTFALALNSSSWPSSLGLYRNGDFEKNISPTGSALNLIIVAGNNRYELR